MVNTPPKTDIFNDLAKTNQRLVDLGEQDFEARAKADIIAKDDKKLSVKSTIDELEINLRKAGRGVREAGLGVAGAGVQIVIYDPNKSPVQTLAQTVTFARSLLNLYDSMKDKSDISGKLKSFRKAAGLDDDKSEDNESHPKISSAESRPTGGLPGILTVR